MANEVEIVITGKNKAKPAVDAAKKDAEGLGKTYRETSKTATSALSHIRDALRHGLRDAIADVHGDTNRISRAFRAVQESAVASLDRTKAAVRSRLTNLFTEKDGQGIGRRIGGGITKGIVGTLRKLTLPGLGGVLASALKGVLSSPIVGTAVAAGLALAVTGGAMALGSALSGGIILGLGAGLVGAAAAALFHVEEVNKGWSKAEQQRVKESNRQAEKLRADWTELGRDIVGGLKRAAQPLIPVLDVVRSTLRSVGREFEPVITQGMKVARGPLTRFVRSLGDGLRELKPAVVPIMTTFGELLDEIGPALPGVFSEISAALVELSTVVSENKDLIAGLFVGLLRTIPMLIGWLGSLTSAFRGTFVFTLGLIDSVLGGLQSLMEFVAGIPGPWQEGARAIAESIASTRGEIGTLRYDVENFPRRVQIEGEIEDLEAKIKAAKKRLRDPNLTNPERTKIKAEISDLQAKVRGAKAQLQSIKDRVVTVRTNFVTTGVPRYPSGTQTLSSLFGAAHGGVIGGGRGLRKMATGGIGGGTPVMVGEQGPELVNLPFGSQVTAAGQTRARMQGGGFGSISMAFRQGQGGSSRGGLGGIVDSLREVLSFREALEKLSSTLIGQTRAVSAYEAAWDAAGRSVKENGKRLSLTSEKGRENRGALLDLAEAAREVVIAMQEQGRSSSTLLATMKEQRSEFIRMARSMGLSKSSASAMADRMGLTTAGVRSALAGGKAAGGPAGGMTLVGERGPELVRLPFGSSVTPAGATAAALAGGAGGGGTLTVVLETRGGDSEFDRFMAAWIRRFVHVKGGNVQTAFGRR